MLLDLESARGAAFYASHAAAGAMSDGEGRADELPVAAAVAKSCCSEAYVRVATDSLHVHGGLGFTWDHDAHLYFKRARSSFQLFGDPGHHRERLARHLGV
jgi:acyl-CoA dehydrogenase